MRKFEWNNSIVQMQFTATCYIFLRKLKYVFWQLEALNDSTKPRLVQCDICNWGLKIQGRFTCFEIVKEKEQIWSKTHSWISLWIYIIWFRNTIQTMFLLDSRLTKTILKALKITRTTTFLPSHLIKKMHLHSYLISIKWKKL